MHKLKAPRNASESLLSQSSHRMLLHSPSEKFGQRSRPKLANWLKTASRTGMLGSTTDASNLLGLASCATAPWLPVPTEARVGGQHGPGSAMLHYLSALPWLRRVAKLHGGERK